MIELIELIQSINRNKIAKIEVMGNPSNYQGKMRRLYDGISNGDFKSDEEAMMALYGEKGERTNYKKLKYRLEQRLINTVFFIDVNKPSFGDTQKVFYNSYKKLVACKILIGRSVIMSPIRIAERTLPKVIEYEFPEIAVGLLKDLVTHYGSRDLNIKKFKRYTELLNTQLKALEAETKANEYDTWIKIKYFKRLASSEELHNEAGTYRKELREYLKITQTPRFILSAFNLFMNEHLLVNNHHEAIKICEEALEIFNKKSNIIKVGQNFFLSYLINLYRQTKEYIKAEKAIKEILNLDFVVKGSNHHFGLYNNYLLVCLYQQDYQKAYEIYQEATFKQDLRKNRKDYQDQFKLHEAFLNFFVAIGKIDMSKSEYPPLPKFRLSRFLNDVPEFAQNKRKHNITLIIIQVLFSIQQKKYDVVIDKVESLNMYCHRYLRKDDTFRSNCFIKLLLVLPKSNFNRIAVERNAKKLLNRLKSVPLEKANQAEDLEIIPYDDLWEMVLDMLDTNTRKVV